MVEENYFVFNGKSSLDFDIAIHDEDMTPVQAPERDIELVEVPGRDGYVTINHNRKMPIFKPIRAILYNPEYKEQVRQWLKGNGELILSNDDGVFYKCLIREEINFHLHFTGGWEFEVIFDCQPRAYLFNGLNIINITSKNTKLFNNYEASYPFIRVFGNGSGELIVNNWKMILENMEHTVNIDSELGEVWQGNNALVVKGYPPSLKKGENNISWNGSISKVEVIPRWHK